MNIKTKNEELNRLDVVSFKKSEKAPVVVVLDDIRSLNNVGSIFRTSDAFRIERIILCGITATPPHRDIRKTALGATESVDWSYVENALDAVRGLSNDGYCILSLEQTSDSVFLNKFDHSLCDKYVVVVGNEVRGVSQSIIDISNHCIEIPQYGTKHSFNVSVSYGIILWELLGKKNYS